MTCLKYYVNKPTAGTPEVEIDSALYQSCKESKTVLTNCLSIEEKYEILLSNYLEFENQILQIATENMVRGHVDYSAFFDLRLVLNMRVVNLLTSARLYTDQLYSAVKRCMPNCPDPKTDVKALLSEQYDGNLDYRFMEALRNFIQHRGLAVHWTSLPSRWTDLGENGLLEYTLEFGTQRTVLAEDGNFKIQVLDEIPKQINLKVAVRSYIESLSNIHIAVRQMISENVVQARAVFDDVYQRYQNVYDGSVTALIIYKRNGLEYEHIDVVQLVRAWDDIRVELQQRNRRLANLHKRYATGKSPEQEAEE